MKITVDVEDLEPGVTSSRAVAAYLRAMLKLRALKRAVALAAVEAEELKQRLTRAELNEAHRLIYDARAFRRPSAGSQGT